MFPGVSGLTIGGISRLLSDGLSLWEKSIEHKRSIQIITLNNENKLKELEVRYSHEKVMAELSHSTSIKQMDANKDIASIHDEYKYQALETKAIGTTQVSMHKLIDHGWDAPNLIRGWFAVSIMITLWVSMYFCRNHEIAKEIFFGILELAGDVIGFWCTGLRRDNSKKKV